jgi:hypothetical protein
MAIGLGRCVVLGLAWSVVVAQGGAGGAGVEEAASPVDEVAPGGLPSSDLVGDPGLPPVSMRPEVRAGFLIRKAAEYGVAPADFDGDRRADLSIKLDGGTWKIDYAANGFGQWDRTFLHYGGPDAIPVPADYDGDRRADLAVKDLQGVWRVDYAADGFGAWNGQVGGYGGRGARPVPADYDGDRRADMAVKDDFTERWSIDFARDGFGQFNVVYEGWGGPNADPVPADYDGDGRADLAVKEDTGRWRIDFAADGFGNVNLSLLGYGDAQSHAVPADYDGDRKADLAVKRDNGFWAIDYSANGFGSFDTVIPGAGGTTARAVPADYDGDRKADLGVRVDCGPWFIDHASNGFNPWNKRFDHMTARDVVTMTNSWVMANTLMSDFTGTVFIPSNSSLRFDVLREVPVKSCVQIRGTRNATDPGPLLFTDDKAEYEEEPYSLFAVTGHDVRIQGVRLRGPSNGSRSKVQVVNGIKVVVDPGLGLGGNVAIEGNEAWFWTGSAVTVEGQVHSAETPEEVPPETPLMKSGEAGLIRIARNSLHHNSMDSKGYGVTVGHGAHATIEGNVFTHNRHAVASGGDPYTGYQARYNYVLEGGYTEGSGYYNQHFDVHGTGDGGYGGVGGELYEIESNNIRGDQSYYVTQTRPAFLLRGTPTVRAVFHRNRVAHDDRGEAVQIKSPDCWVQGPWGGGYYSDELCHLTVGANTYGVDTAEPDLAVGDFDGDGLDDVFLANGTGWWYSSAGRTEWRFLRPSTLRIPELRFGRFDADARTDVLFSTATEWQFSSAGTANPVPLRAGGIPVSRCVFGDFDGNGLTDALYATGSTWYLFHDSKGTWSTIRSSTVTPANLRVGDFDGDGNDDVFAVEHGTWSWWRLGWSNTYPLNGPLTSSASGLVVGDFDGDSYDDIAQTSGSGWRYSRGGSSPWAPLRGSGGQDQYKDIRSVLVGRFTREGGDDALRYELVRKWIVSSWQYVTGVRFVGWDGTQDAFRQWSAEYVR